VREKVRSRGLRREEIIPDEVCGLPTDVIAAAVTAPASASDAPGCAPPTMGAGVTNLRGVLGGESSGRASGGSGLGALGFFAATNGTTERLDVLLVSNRHVLLAHGAKRGDHIYQPTYTYNEGAYEFRRSSLRPVAEISNEGYEGNYIYSYPGESPEAYFIDCAAARLCDDGVRLRC
jgi:hypothetical protein